MVKISVIIPTLQKNLSFLINLLSTLERDTSVDEIIVIDNSLRGLNYKSSKLKLIIPEENLFVNPSWNLGVKEAKNELVALLNDDIIIPDGFCSRIAEKMNALRGGGGCVGFCGDNIIVTKDLVPQPEQTSIELTATDTRCLYWGIVIFFYSSSFIQNYLIRLKSSTIIWRKVLREITTKNFTEVSSPRNLLIKQKM